jgi:mannosyltransferase OCH1-like enzyme
MIPRQIHQVFLTFSENPKTLEDYPVFVSQKEKTMKHCKEYGIDYKFWSEKDCNELVKTKYPHYDDFYHSMRYGVQRVDFIRYLILYEYGGLYIDLDICPINNLRDVFTKETYFVKWDNCKKNLPYNAVLGSAPKHRIFKDILAHCLESYKEKVTMECYETWVGRFVFQTTGHLMVERVLKKYPFVGRWNVMRIHTKEGTIVEGHYPLFEDYCISSWYNEHHHTGPRAGRKKTS